MRKLTKIQAKRAPDILCQAEKIAPGTVAIGIEVKCALARPVARPEFCMPTSTERAIAFFQLMPVRRAKIKPNR